MLSTWTGLFSEKLRWAFFLIEEQAKSLWLLAISIHSGFYFSSSHHFVIQVHYNLFNRLPIIKIINIEILNWMTVIHVSLFLLPVYDNMMLFCKLIHSTWIHINVLLVVRVRQDFAGTALLASCGRCATLHLVGEKNSYHEEKYGNHKMLCSTSKWWYWNPFKSILGNAKLFEMCKRALTGDWEFCFCMILRGFLTPHLSTCCACSHFSSFWSKTASKRDWEREQKNRLD